jgi:photosynthetic reaction center H subunit
MYKADIYNANFVGNFDITALTLLAFTIFFIGLVLYLRREDRREGYPLEDDATGRLESPAGFLWAARPKTFKLMHSEPSVSKPDGSRDSFDLSARRSANWSGAPLEPLGDPMQAAIGPGAYAKRADKPDRITTGDVRIVPMRVAKDFSPAKEDPDPRGMTVLGADGVAGGAVSDIWIDRADYIVRYLEVALAGAEGAPTARRVLVPMTMATIDSAKRRVVVEAVLGSQFAGAPTITNPDQITLLEEDRIVAYYGGGYLYATKARAEPLL